MQSKIVLIKYGGNAMLNQDLKVEIANKIKALESRKIQVVLVHGGGPFINLALERAGIASEFVEGHRYTTPQALVEIEKTLKGEVNSGLVSVFNNVGLKAVGLSGKDGRMVVAERRHHTNEAGEKLDLGQVGNVKEVDCQLVRTLIAADYTPVITCIASDKEGHNYNVNADMFAGNLAAALEVDEYIVLTDVDGLYENYPDPNSLIRQVSLEELNGKYEQIITGGMIPKIESCEIALKQGARKAVILNGTKPSQIEDYLLHRRVTGTTIVR